jgi:predicted transposase/invertase (TIGR01784 family)
MNGRIQPTSDLGFKKIIGTSENKDVLQGIINDFFDLLIPIDGINITVPYDIRAYDEYLKLMSNGGEVGEMLRETVEDVVADIKTADFGAEVQVKKDTYYSKRSLYYACVRFCSNYNLQGKMVYVRDRPIRYSSLKPVYMLNILGYPHFKDDDALRVFTFYDSKRKKAFEIEYLTIAYFELKKSNIETVNQRYWKEFFKTGEALEGAPDYIKKAACVIERVNLTKEERDMYDRLQKAEDKYASELYTAIMESKEEGRVEGRVEGEKSIVLNMIGLGKSIDDVAKDTGLSIDEIRKFLH